MAGTTLTLNDILGDGLEKGLERIETRMRELDALMKSIAAESKSINTAVKDNSSNRQTSGSGLSNRKKQLEELRTELGKLSAVESEYIRLETSRQMLITKQNEKLKESQIALQREKQALADRNKTLQAGAGSLKEMETRLAALRREYANLSATERNAANSGGALLKNIQSLSKETDQLRVKMGQAQQRVGGYAAAIKEVGSVFAGQLGLYGGIAGGIAMITGAFTSGLNIIKNYSLEWSKLRALVGTGTSKADFAALQISSGAGLDLGKSATDVTKLQIELARFGLTARQIVDVTPGILKLSAVTGEDLSKSAATVAANLKSFNLEANQSDRVVGVLARVFNESASGLSDFAESSKYAAPSAKAAGVSVEFMSAAIAKLADRGIKGSMAGTSLRRIFNEMAKSGKDVETAWKEITSKGITVADAFDEVGLTAQNALMILSENKTEVDAFGKSLLDVSKNAQVVSDGVKTMTDNLTGDLNKLSGAWESLWLSIDKGDGVLSKISRGLTKLVTDAVKNLTVLTQGAGDVYQQTQANVTKNLQDKFKGIEPGSTEFFIKNLQETEKLKAEIQQMKRGGAAAYMGSKGAVDISTPLGFLELKKREQEYTNVLFEKEQTLKRLNLIYTNAKSRQELLKSTTLDNLQTEQESVKTEKELAKELKTTNSMREQYYNLLKKYGLLTSSERVEHETKLLDKMYNAGLIKLEEYAKNYMAISRKINGLPELKGQESVGKLKVGRAQVATGVEGMQTDRFSLLNTLAGDMNEVWDYFGVSKDRQDELNSRLQSVTGLARETVSRFFDIRQASIDKEIKQREDRINEIENLLQREYDLQRQAKEKGDRFDETRLKDLEARKAKEEQLRKDALAKEEKLNKQRAIADQLSIARALTVASANIIKGWSTLGIPGRVLGIAEVVLLLTQFAAIRKSINANSKAAKGTSGTFGGAYHSESTGERGLIYDGQGNSIETERGEAYAVLSRNATNKYGRQFFDFVHNANSDNFSKFGAKSSTFVQLNTAEMVSEQRKTNELLSRMPVSRGTNEFSTLGGNLTVRKIF